jgi:hypothetical protein
MAPSVSWSTGIKVPIAPLSLQLCLATNDCDGIANFELSQLVYAKSVS